MLVTMKEILTDARKRGYAVGAFEFWSYDSARAVVSAADRLGVPAILQIGHFERDYLDGYRNARRIAEMVAERYPLVPVALHLDHAESYEEIEKALEADFTSVMIDASSLPFEENVAITRKVVELAGKYGASTEAELGTLAGSEGAVEGTDLQTDPCQAAEFAERTGIDSLAVAIGTAHGFYTKTPEINIGRLREIAGKVAIPLVLHGGSGTPEDKIREAVRNGIAKVNICTEFIAAFGRQISAEQQSPDFRYDVYRLFREGMLAGERLAESRMRLFDPDQAAIADKMQGETL